MWRCKGRNLNSNEILFVKLDLNDSPSHRGMDGQSDIQRCGAAADRPTDPTTECRGERRDLLRGRARAGAQFRQHRRSKRLESALGVVGTCAAWQKQSLQSSSIVVVVRSCPKNLGLLSFYPPLNESPPDYKRVTDGQTCEQPSAARIGREFGRAWRVACQVKSFPPSPSSSA